MRDNSGSGQCRNPFRGAEFVACPSEHPRTAHRGAHAWRLSGECDGNLPQHVRWLAGLQHDRSLGFHRSKRVTAMRNAITMRWSGNSKGNIRSYRTESMQCMWILPTVGFPRNSLTVKIVIGAPTRLKFFIRSKNIKMQTALTWKSAFGVSNSPKRLSVFMKSKK